jgi:hypothetical protein
MAVLLKLKPKQLARLEQAILWKVARLEDGWWVDEDEPEEPPSKRNHHQRQRKRKPKQKKETKPVKPKQKKETKPTKPARCMHNEPGHFMSPTVCKLCVKMHEQTEKAEKKAIEEWLRWERWFHVWNGRYSSRYTEYWSD